MKRTLASLMLTAAAVLMLAGCGQGTGDRGSETAPTIKDEDTGYTFLEEDTITLEDGRTLTCITTSRSSGGVSCNWDDATDGR